MKKRNLCYSAFVVLSLAILGQLGCAAQTAGHSAAELQDYNKQRNIDPNKVNQFLGQLAGVPAAQRRDFINQHPDDMRSLGQVQDPAVQARFQEIVRGSK